MKLFAPWSSDTELDPRQNSDVVRLRAALDTAQQDAAPHAHAWAAYRARHYEDTICVPWPEDKARLANADREAQQAVQHAAAALDLALTAATERAKEAWNARILENFRDDGGTITACIDLLDRHEQLVDEASRAGVQGVHKVSELFITSAEVRARWAYAKTALGLS